MKIYLSIITIFLLSIKSHAQSLKATLVDVGAGLCVVLEIPNDMDTTDPYYMLYDVGQGCKDDIQGIIPATQQIDLMVLSHNDSDHISNADDILELYEVKKILWSGFERQTLQTWKDVNYAIDNETNAEIINLKNDDIAIGTTWIFGQTYVTFVSGFHVPPTDWGFTSSNASEYRNAGSIVMRIVHKGKSILLTGDMVGRHETASFPDSGVIAAEKYVLDNRFAVPIDSDILVASHHGGDDGSSYPFIHAVSPEYVIFPAGSKDTYGHPRASTAQRFLNSGVLLEHIFRTDREDDESHVRHWEPKGNTGINDRSGDDSIIISISDNGKITLSYKN